jgi:hypothetical protein
MVPQVVARLEMINRQFLWRLLKFDLLVAVVLPTVMITLHLILNDGSRVALNNTLISTEPRPENKQQRSPIREDEETLTVEQAPGVDRSSSHRQFALKKEDAIESLSVSDVFQTLSAVDKVEVKLDPETTRLLNLVTTSAEIESMSWLSGKHHLDFSELPNFTKLVPPVESTSAVLLTPTGDLVFPTFRSTSILAALGGTVKAIDYGAGNKAWVTIDHGNGYFSTYGGLATLLVKAGQPVSKGDLIGNGILTARPTEFVSFYLHSKNDLVDPRTLIFDAPHNWVTLEVNAEQTAIKKPTNMTEAWIQVISRLIGIVR